MASDQALVSVIVLCYNQARYVVETLESVERQTYPHVELIVIDDSSTDDSVGAIREWASRTCGRRRSWHTGSTRVSVARSMRRWGWRVARTSAVVAADDAGSRTRCSRQVETFEVVPADARWFIRMRCGWTRRQPLPGPFVARHRQFTILPKGDLFAVLIGGNFLPALTPRSGVPRSMPSGATTSTSRTRTGICGCDWLLDSGLRRYRADGCLSPGAHVADASAVRHGENRPRHSSTGSRFWISV